MKLYGTSGFVIGWLGSAVSAGVESLYRVGEVNQQTRKDNARGGGSFWQFVWVFGHSCLLVSTGSIEVLLPIYITLATTVRLSVACITYSWLPFPGHAGHLGGLGFGALYFALSLRGKPFSSGNWPARPP